MATDSNPVVLHVQRPYESADAYLEAEAWTIDTKSMLLIVSEVLPANTPVLFDVSIANGDKVIRAEGKVAGVVAASEGKPGGLRVRFKRYGASTKAFIERALAPKPAPEAAPVPQVVTPTMKAAAPDAELPAEPPGLHNKAPEFEPKLPEVEPAITAAPLAEPNGVSEPSGVHRRPPDVIEAPPNRDAFLARLRERAKTIDVEAVSSAPAELARG